MRLQRKTINTLRVIWKFCQFQQNQNGSISKLSRVSLHRSSLRLKRKTHNINTLRVMSKFCQFHQNQNVAYRNCPEFPSKDRAWDCKEKPTTSTLWGSCQNSVSFYKTRMLHIETVQSFPPKIELEIAKKNPQHRHFEGHVKILSVLTKLESCISKLRTRVSIQGSSLHNRW
jgi:hypothetical protein